MKIYLAVVTYDYEGGVLLGVYTTRELAEERLKEDEAMGDDRFVQDIEINSPVEVWI